MHTHHHCSVLQSVVSEIRFRYLALHLAGGLITSGCAVTPLGSKGIDAFIQDSEPALLSGPRTATDAAQCFQERGRFLPMSEFSNDSAAGLYTYRLRLSDLWFEQVLLTKDGTGSRAEWRLAPNLDATWRAHFVRDRLEPLRLCIGS